MFSCSCDRAGAASAEAMIAVPTSNDTLFMLILPRFASGFDNPHSRQLRCADMGGELLFDIRRQFETEPRARRHGNIPILYLGHRRDKIAVPGTVIGTDALLDEGIRRV